MGRKEYFVKLNQQSGAGAGAGLIWPLGAEAAQKKNTRSWGRSRFGKKSGAGAA